jgi:hypothetical protein
MDPEDWTKGLPPGIGGGDVAECLLKPDVACDGLFDSENPGDIEETTGLGRAVLSALVKRISSIGSSISS